MIVNFNSRVTRFIINLTVPIFMEMNNNLIRIMAIQMPLSYANTMKRHKNAIN